MHDSLLRHSAICLVGGLLVLTMILSPPAANAKPAGESNSVRPAPAQVAITVDDIPDHGDLMPGITRRQISVGVIHALKTDGVSSVYGFTNGTFMQDDPHEMSILKLWLRAGYPLGNHTYHHPDLTKIGARPYIDDIGRQDRLLARLAGDSSLIAERHMFRYPYLDEGNTLAKRNAVRAYLFSHGYRIAEVTTDYYDWAWTDAYTRCTLQHDQQSVRWLKQHIIAAADKHLRESEQESELLFKRNIPYILLIHVGIFDAVMLDSILRHWRAEGVRFISLNQALADPIYRINPNVTYDDGRNFLEQIAMARKVDVSALEDNVYTIDRLNGFCRATHTANR